MGEPGGFRLRLKEVTQTLATPLVWKISERTETPHNIPTELLEHILGYITEFEDIWFVGKVNSIFSSIIWKNVERLEFVFGDRTCTRSQESGKIKFDFSSLHIRQKKEDPKKFGGKLQTVLNFIPAIWERSENLSELDFGVLSPSSLEGRKLKPPFQNVFEVWKSQLGDSTADALNELASLIEESQRQWPKRIRKLTLNQGFERSSAFCTIIKSCSRELESLKALSTALHGHLLPPYEKMLPPFSCAISLCSKLKSAQVTLFDLVPALMDLPGLRELDLYTSLEPETLPPIPNYLSVLASPQNITVRVMGDRENLLNPLYYDRRRIIMQFHWVTSLAVLVKRRTPRSHDYLFTDIMPNLACVLFIVDGRDSYDSGAFECAKIFLDAFMHSSEAIQRQCTVKLTGLHKNDHAAQMMRITDTIRKEMSLVGSVVRLEDVEERGGVEVDEDEFDREEYVKFEVGNGVKSKCFIGPVS